MLRYILRILPLVAIFTLSLYADHELNTKYSQKKLDFTPEELVWMDAHPTIKYTGDPNWLPFEAFTIDGKYVGIVAEHLKLIDAMLPLKIDIVASKSWEQSVAMIKNGDVDMISETTDSKLVSNLVFTDAYITNPIVIVMKNSDEYINGISQIKNKKIAVIKDYGYIYQIREKYPDILFIETDNIQDALLGVSSGKYDALLADLGLSSYTIATMGINNLTVVGKTEFETHIGFGIRSDYKELVGIINKAIAAIEPNDMQTIMQQWNVQKLGNLIDYGLVWEIVIAALTIAALLFYWNAKMAIEIKKRKAIEQELLIKNKHIADSINYASLIQSSILPDENEAKSFFGDFFAIWEPKDVVGGDIYLFEKLQNKNSALLMVIDCTGHGVPGAFMTMLVKAIERNIISMLTSQNQDIHPADILQIFNKSVKSYLKQHSKSSASNAGFDGAVIYIDKDLGVVRFAGAQTPLFYFDKQNELVVIKGDRQGIGYINSKENFIFKEHELQIQDIATFFISTDGYTDQNGGAKELPFGKTRFCNILKESCDKPMEEIKVQLLYALKEWQGAHERNDDLTVVGVRI